MKTINKILDYIDKHQDGFLGIFFLIISIVLCLLWYDWKLFLIIFLLSWSNNHNLEVMRLNREKERIKKWVDKEAERVSKSIGIRLHKK